MGSRAAVLTVTKLLEPIDMRSIHGPRSRVRCEVGEAWLMLNKAHTIARLVDAVGAVHTYYAPIGRVWDHVVLTEAVGVMGLRLRPIAFGQGMIARKLKRVASG